MNNNGPRTAVSLLCVVTTQVPRGRVYPNSGRTGGGDGGGGGEVTGGEKKWGGGVGGRKNWASSRCFVVAAVQCFVFVCCITRVCCVITAYRGLSQLN